MIKLTNISKIGLDVLQLKKKIMISKGLILGITAIIIGAILLTMTS